MNPSAELKNAMLRLYESIAAGDMSAVERLYSHKNDLLVIGTDPGEWWVGYETFARVHQAQFEEMGGNYTIKPGELSAFVEGTVGWAGGRATILPPDGQNIPIRVTVVFHQEDGGWKIMQHYVSVGIPNSEAVGREFTVR